jgi:hypothetical protein
MGLIVPFQRRSATPRRPRSDRPCDVTLFPGVRYERGPLESLPLDRIVPDRPTVDTRLPDETRR